MQGLFFKVNFSNEYDRSLPVSVVLFGKLLAKNGFDLP